MFRTIRGFMLDIRYRVRSLIFRLRHGFALQDTWALNTAVAQFLAPRLRHMAEHHVCYPPDLEDDAAWTVILYTMADAFKAIADDDWDPRLDDAEEGLDLFRQYFFYLWD